MKTSLELLDDRLSSAAMNSQLGDPLRTSLDQPRRGQNLSRLKDHQPYESPLGHAMTTLSGAIHDGTRPDVQVVDEKNLKHYVRAILGMTHDTQQILPKLAPYLDELSKDDSESLAQPVTESSFMLLCVLYTACQVPGTPTYGRIDRTVFETWLNRQLASEPELASESDQVNVMPADYFDRVRISAGEGRMCKVGTAPSSPTVDVLPMRRSDFHGEDLRNADLENASLEGANFRGTNLEHACLMGAHLDGAILTEAKLERANLQDANLQDANLQDAKLKGANLEGANLKSAWMLSTDLTCACLKGANLELVDASDAGFENANLEHADLRSAAMWGAKLAGAKLTCAKLEGVEDLNLTGVNLSEVALDGVTYTLDGLGCAIPSAVPEIAATRDTSNLDDQDKIDSPDYVASWKHLEKRTSLMDYNRCNIPGVDRYPNVPITSAGRLEGLNASLVEIPGVSRMILAQYPLPQQLGGWIKTLIKNRCDELIVVVSNSELESDEPTMRPYFLPDRERFDLQPGTYVRRLDDDGARGSDEGNTRKRKRLSAGTPETGHMRGAPPAGIAEWMIEVHANTESRKIHVTHINIADDLPPSLDQLDYAVARAANLTTPDASIAIHCRAGVGRTGTVAAAIVLDRQPGRGVADVALELRGRRSPFMINSIEQFDAVCAFASKRKTMSMPSQSV